MREIKFRAFAHASKTMFYPDSEAGWELHFGSINALPNTTLMQFTGLYDVKGKPIYEGDIIRRDDGILSVHFGSSAFGLSVHRSDGVFASQWQLYGGKDKGEIIGNIYENPDLLTH